MTGAQTTEPLTTENIVAFIGDIFKRRGAESYLGEDVTMSEHMLQGATLAQQAGASDVLIAGALLHDIGHYTNEFPEDALARGTDNLHEEAGARVLDGFFPSMVTDCIRWHVAAKRYLCATDPTYFSKLSEASVHTLNLQGGPMDAAEVAEFAKQPNLNEILQVRIWDDQGKVPGMPTPDFDDFAPLLQRVADAHAATQT
ncbi:(R)-1-hydroxy-2-trimethylaminoethylphosphonate oxygenase [Roseovarius sp. ZX-A-9]|uniref:(R)-1-hydroxy-2-trimethylaminoethylphosphonate oxygenase n=1 Tax=Roseovarius sp. ZX-A-9 TaxID=3014783 RepID=UPI00232F4EEC|nr:HD domain-containing protein [Roseovarius sp. ZX-A-9]